MEFLKTLYGSSEDVYSSQHLAYVSIPQTVLDARLEDIATPKVAWVQDSITFRKDDLWLDIGSGTGDVLVAAKKLGFRVQGVEASFSEIEIAKKRFVPTTSMYFDGSQPKTVYRHIFAPEHLNIFSDCSLDACLRIAFLRDNICGFLNQMQWIFSDT